MTRRSPEFLLVILNLFLVICLAVVVYSHVRYSAAEKVYVDHLQRVVFSPHSNLKADLAAYAQPVNQWLRVRTVASIVAAVAIGAILWQVTRRRNQRVAQAMLEETEA